MSNEIDVMDGIAELETAPRPALSDPDRDDGAPWEHANEHLDLRELLIDCGWKPAGHSGGGWENFTRPGKSHGPSGGISPDGKVFKVFSSSVPELADTLSKSGGMDAWGFFVRYSHAGDFKRAASDYRKRFMPKTGEQAPPRKPDETLVNAGWQIQDAAGILASPPPKPGEIIKGLLFERSKMFLNGPSKARKTFCQIDLGACIASGTPWMGLETVKGRVLYVNLELHPWSFQARLKAILDKRGITLEPGHFDVLHLRGQKATIEGLERWAFGAIQANTYSLIIFDPLYKIMGERDENSAGGMGDLLLKLEAIGHHAGAAILIAHHYAKGNAAGKEAMDRASGSGVVARDGDTILMLTPHEEEDCFTLDYILRDFAPIPPTVVRWNYPTFEPDTELDPARLKQPSKPELKEITDEHVLDAASGFAKNREQLVRAVKDATGRGLNACREAVNRVIGAGLLKEIRVARSGTNPLIQYSRKESA